ncbi:MAG TPA: 2Fe-2S iron-sulfur cluster binding domain-containing protein [Clostridiaceae bacterium]|nr:2Fe-2S iron-sulfur cluster binding domain-containing protein [Clostridiaceae bacterium]
MEITFELNGKPYTTEVRPDETLLETLRNAGCFSVKCGCETTNCGLCTVFINDEPRLSCAYPSPRAKGKNIVTLEGLPIIAAELGEFIAGHGAEQCGFCNPGFIMNIIAMEREFALKPGDPLPSEEEMRRYLVGNLCRCSGYESQLRGIVDYFRYRYEVNDKQQDDVSDVREQQASVIRKGWCR